MRLRGRGGRILAKQSGQPSRLGAELDANGRFGRRAVIPLVEQQVERAPDGREPRGEIGVGQIEQALRRCQHLLAARDPLLDRRAAGEERGRDLAGAKPAEDVEDQRDLGVFGKPRMTAGKHHPQLLVADRAGGECLLDNRRARPLGLEQPAQLRRERPGRTLAAQDVERPILRGGHQPGTGILRDAARLPHLQRAAEGVLHDVFCQRQVVHPEEARERGDHAPRLAAEEVLVEVSHRTVSSPGRSAASHCRSGTAGPSAASIQPATAGR